MANLVEQIGDAFETEIIAAVTALTASNELQHIYDVEKNKGKVMENGFGVRPLDAATSGGVITSYTLDQGFEMILTRTIGRTSNDDDKKAAVYLLYDRSDQILKRILNNQLAIPTIVLSTRSPSIPEVEFIGESQSAVLRVQVIVKYRSDLN